MFVNNKHNHKVYYLILFEFMSLYECNLGF